MATGKKEIVSLVLISFLVLFLELLFIRWLPAHILSLAYFSNLVLISCFLGLGIGCLMPSEKMFRLFPYFLLLAVGVVFGFRFFEVIVPNPSQEWIWASYTGNKLSTSQWSLGIFQTLLVVYGLNTLLFVPIGQKMAFHMNQFTPLRAYSWNILGSFLGLAAFGLFSFIGGRFNSPVIWFGVAGLVLVWFFQDESGSRKVWLSTALVLLCSIVYVGSRSEIWSPYYSLQLRTFPTGTFYVYVNQFFHQQALDFSTDIRAREKYSLPYRIKKPQKLLIFGSGTGNDVAIANFYGVPHIDAVELDPTIASIGKQLHPNRPYDNPNVRLHINDARSYLKRTQEKYDMIILGTLDSHALLSALSTVRLDNFVYTEESIQEIKAHLTDEGVAVLMFSVPVPWLGDKLVELCRRVFSDQFPIVFFGSSKLFNLMVVAGPGVTPQTEGYLQNRSLFAPITKAPYQINLPTDNWPYLYLRNRAIPSHYVKVIGLLFGFSVLTLGWVLRNKRGVFRGSFFCLGVGFMLLETKSVSTLSLLFGSTWVVNVFVFGSILLMILLANMITEKIHARYVPLLYGCLLMALLLNYVVPVGSFLAFDFWTRSILSSVMTALPLFFAALLFAQHIRTTSEMGMALGANLAGAVLGGFLEYSAMAVGLKNLYPIAAGFYLMAFLFSKWEGKKLQ